MPSKECLPYKDQDIIGNIAVTRNQPEQSIGMKSAGASTTLSYRLVGDDRSDPGQNCLAPRLLHEKPLATVAGIPFRSESHNGWLRKQNGG